MAINSNEYVNIVSGKGGGATFSTKELGLRVFSALDTVPTGSILKFGDLESVLDYFNSEADEYKIARQHFSFVSKNITSPRLIEFARWAKENTRAEVFGSKAASVEVFKKLTPAEIVITLAGKPSTVTFDFTTCENYTAICTEAQDKIRASGDVLKGASVVMYNPKNQINLFTDKTADGEIEISGDKETLDALGWGNDAVFSAGVKAQSITEVLTKTTELSNNFGSFKFIDYLSLAQAIEAGKWNDEKNNDYQFHIEVKRADAKEYTENLIGYSGLGVTLKNEKNLDEYGDVLPCSILASQDFEKPGAVTNYMFTTESILSPTVTNTAESRKLNEMRVNYIGETQVAGQFASFYQRGVLMGGSNDLTSMSTYANAQWLKAELKVGYMNLLLAMPIISADDEGRSCALLTMMDAVEKAQNNGIITSTKKLTTLQKQYIKQITGSDTAYFDVESKGYYPIIEISTEMIGGVINYIIDYTLLYAQRNVVNAVHGRHVAI